MYKENLVILTTEEGLSEEYRADLTKALESVKERTNTAFLVLFGDWKVVGNVSVKEILEMTEEGNVVLKDIKEAK